MRLTLKTKSALLTTALVLVLVGATGWWQYRQLSEGYVRLLTEQQQALARGAASDLDYKLAMHLAVVVRAASQAREEVFRDPALQQRFLRDSGLLPMFDGSALVAADGAVLANDPPISRTLNIADRDYFQRSRETGRPAISAPLMARTVDQPAVVMIAPVQAADGRLLGMVSAGLNLLRPNILGDLSRANAGPGAHYVIVTTGPSPLTVMHPDRTKLLKPPPAADSPPDDDPTARDLVTHATIATTGWDLRVVAPARSAYAPLARARQALWQQLAVLGLACGLFVWLATAWMMRPIESLSAAIARLRRSPDEAVKIDTTANDERGQLARDFAALMSELRDQRAETAAILDAAPLGLFRADTEGRMTYVNDAYLEIHRLAREDMADGWIRLLREEIRETVRAEWARLAKGREPVQAVRRLHRADGSKVLISMRSRAVIVDGQVVGHVGTVSDITERTRAERALRTLTAVFDATTDYVVQLDAGGRLTYMNPAARRRTGVAPDAPIEHLTMADFNPPQTLARLLNEIVPAVRTCGIWVGESQVWDAQRREFPVSHMVIGHRDKHGRVEYYSALMRDISAAKAAEQALQLSEARLRTVADALPMRVAYIDADERYRFNNLAYERGFGLTREQIQGRTVRELLGDAAYASVEPRIRAALSGETVTFQSEMTGRDSYVCYEASYIPQFAADGQRVVGFHAVITDITRQKLEEKRLVNLARVDPLTGLVNRAGFELRLTEAMSRTRSTGALMALMYLDIDHFKQINDSLGHNAGDELLRGFAGRLSQTLRSSDTVARLGGDEFTVIMEGLSKPEVAATVAAKIVQAMSTPFSFEQQTLRVTTSIGLAFYQGGTATPHTLIKQADEMLYQAKGAGRNNVQMALRVVEGGRT